EAWPEQLGIRSGPRTKGHNTKETRDNKWKRKNHVSTTEGRSKIEKFDPRKRQAAKVSSAYPYGLAAPVGFGRDKLQLRLEQITIELLIRFLHFLQYSAGSLGTDFIDGLWDVGSFPLVYY